MTELPRAGDPPEPDAGDPPDETKPAAYPPSSDDETPAVPPSADAGTTRALAALLKLTPFLDLHRAANNEGHRFRGWLCFTLDLLLRLLVVGLLVCMIGAIAWKTLAPLPDLGI